MAYALRYYKELAQADGGVIRLEIHKKDSTTSAVEIGAVVQGLSLEIQGQQDDIDTPIQKTSLHMTFVDASDIENGQKNGLWEEFYTPDALMWRVILKAKNAQETSFRTIWGGYVTPDSFSEDLVYRGSVSITARDNIGHMQDFPFDALGDADGLISLYNLVSMGWEKIQSPMKLSWKGTWLDCSGSIAYDTLMNVSQFKDGNWYKAIETALASYGAVMRYVGDNTVIITTLRSLPGQGGRIDDLPHINPLFVTGATRELVPAVKRIEEIVDYELEDSWSIPQIQPSDYTGLTYTYRCKVDGEQWGTVEHDAPVWAIPINNERGWDNFPSESLFFNIDAYEVGYFSDYRGLGEEMKRYMYIAANNVDDRSVWYSKQITCADVSLRIKFGLPVCLNRDSQIEQMSVFALKSIRYTISLKKDGSVLYYAGSGTWQVDEKILEKTYDISASETEFVEQIGMDDNVGICDLVFEIKKIEYAKTGYGSIANIGLYACIQDIAFTTSSTSSLRETNTVNTSYNADNNVILSRDPELGPAYDNVAIPAFIKNGIFYRNADDEILPARLWSWGGSEQQMAVWNHLQLLCYYAKPNNLISGTIVNADITRVAAIYEWGHAEHILVSGRYNFLNGHIEGAVLREFARYEDMWSEVAGAAMPETEQDSRSNVEGGASSSSSPSTYTATQNVNIGTGGGGGGASYLGDLQDVDVTGVVAQSVLYYNGTSWVDMSLATLVNPLLNPYLKASDAEATYATLTALNNLASRVKAEEDITATYKPWWDDLKSLIVKDGTNNIKINGNLIVAGDTSTGGTGGNSGADGTLIGVVVNGTQYNDETNGMLDLSTLMNKYALATAIPTSLPASDVYDWAKAATKPSYTKSEVGLANVDNLAASGYLTALSSNTTNAVSITVGGTTKNITAATMKTSLSLGSLAYKSSLGKADVGLGNVENKSSATIRGEITSSNVTNALGYTPANNASLADYLPLSGGTMSLNSTIKWTHASEENWNTAVKGLKILRYASTANASTNGSFAGYTTALHVANSTTYAFQIGYDAGHTNSNYISSLKYRGYSPNRSAWGAWKTVAFTDSNVASATKLATARTIWGQSFNGTGDVDGGFVTSYDSWTMMVNTNHEIISYQASGKYLNIGYSTAADNYSTYLNGYNLYLRYGANATTGITLNSSGRVLIGTTTDSGYKLDVNGVARATGWIGNNVNISCDANGNTSGYSGEINRFGGGKLWIQGRQGGLELGNSAGINFNGAVTMSSTLNVGGNITIQPTATSDVSLLFVTGNLSDGYYDYKIGKFTDKNSVSGFGMAMANASAQWTKFLSLTTDGKYNVTSVNILTNLVVSGDTSTGSDIRFKDKITDHRIALSDIANAPLFTFKWNDREDDSVHLGSSAQYWEKVAPWLVKGEDFKTLDYSTLGVAIGISLANKTLNHEERIKILEKENKALKEQIRRLRYGS